MANIAHKARGNFDAQIAHILVLGFTGILKG